VFSLKIAFETGSLSLYGYGYEEYMKLASDMNFDAVEVWCDKKDLWPRLLRPAQRKKIKESINQYGMKVVAILPDAFLKVRQWKLFDFRVNIAHPSAKMRRDSVRFYNTALDVGRDLDAEVVLALPGAIEQPNMMLSKSSFRNYWDRAIESLRECAKHAQDVGVRLGVENAVVCNFVDRPEELLKMLKQVGSEYVKAYVDLANGNVFAPPVEYVETLRDWLCSCIHVSDNDGSYASHLPIGMGTIDYKTCIEALKGVGWDGYLVPEIFYAKDPEGGVRKSRDALFGLLS
jgi:sugar phosphate isomerase/epimerase